MNIHEEYAAILSRLEQLFVAGLERPYTLLELAEIDDLQARAWELFTQIAVSESWKVVA